MIQLKMTYKKTNIEFVSAISFVSCSKAYNVYLLFLTTS
jgi:hypothetical protein